MTKYRQTPHTASHLSLLKLSALDCAYCNYLVAHRRTSYSVAYKSAGYYHRYYLVTTEHTLNHIR